MAQARRLALAIRRRWTAYRLAGVGGRPRLRIALALQGGGSFGAFTWGVVDRLLDEGEVWIDAVSGASAGAVNAVLLASGLAEGGRRRAREKLEGFWRGASEAALSGRHAPAARSLGASAAGSLAVDLSTRLFSPYQLNPLNINPLRDLLAGHVDFAGLRDNSPVRLLIAATRVRDGRSVLFRDPELTLDMVLASACLPLIHHAVAVGGDWYWDGGYTANPPLLPLVAETGARDIMLVQITPPDAEDLPVLPSEIAKRVTQIGFTSPLLKELEALAAMRALAGRWNLLAPRLARRLRRLRLHPVVAQDATADLARASASNLDWRFVTGLRDSGRQAAEAWLDEQRIRPSSSGVRLRPSSWRGSGSSSS